MPTSTQVTGVLMVGSVPAESVREAFIQVVQELPGRLSSIPDGEIALRGNYIGWQLQRFPPETRRPHLGGEPFAKDEYGNAKIPLYGLADIKPTGYDTVALASYAEFQALKAQGIIPDGVRFQICLPTPFDVIQGHVKPEVSVQIEPLYEQRLMEALSTIIGSIPAEDLVIQWDLCFNITALEFDRGRLNDDRHHAYFLPPIKAGLLTRIFRLCDRIPADVPVAIHLCYGDLRHQHFVEPFDLGLCVEVANDLLSYLGDRVAWIHMPVPKNRTDTTYFEPLVHLLLPENTRLFVGLVHAHDEQGTRKRVDVAQSVCPYPFGVASECGLGRTPKEDVGSILNIARTVSSEIGK